jgi:hypothetical protein
MEAQQAAAEQPPPVIDFETEHSIDPHDQQACRQRLQRIQEALDWYRERNQRALPHSLSELLGPLLADEMILICPFVERTGRSKGWRYGLRGEVWSDQQTSYAYEFSGSQLHLYAGFNPTLHDFKMRQVEFLNRRGAIGGMVPVVRCFAHRPVLNLAYSGVIYESEVHWEDHADIAKAGVTHDELMANALFANPIRERMRQLTFPPRDPSCGPEHLDLTEHYNATLTMAWHDALPGNDLAKLPQGLQELAGQTYDVRGVIQLKGRMLSTPFPEQVTGIQVNRSCRRIHFLHATSFSEHVGTRIGHFRIRYVDGLDREIPIVYGRDVEDWWFRLKPVEAPTNCAVAWRGDNEPTRTHGRGVRLYHTQWDNPRAQVDIASIDYVSAMTHSGPFLIAITVE